MTSATRFSPPVQAALNTIDEAAYTIRPDGTKVPQTSSPRIIATMLDLLNVRPGMRVLEIGTGSGFSTALLAHLVGDDGHVVSIEVDPALTERAGRLLRNHGHPNTDLLTGDGVKGAPGFNNHFDRIIAWATVDRIPRDWAVQALPGAVIVTPVNLTELAKTSAVVRSRYDDALPGLVAETLIPGGFVEACDRVLDQWLVPPRGVDALAHDDEDKPWWLSAHWLRTETGNHGQALLERLITGGRTVPGPLSGHENSSDFYAYLLTARPHGLTTAALGDPAWFIGCGNPDGITIITPSNGREAIHAGDNAATGTLNRWAEEWRELGRPGLARTRPQLEQDEHGWRVRTALST